MRRMLRRQARQARSKELRVASRQWSVAASTKLAIERY